MISRCHICEIQISEGWPFMGLAREIFGGDEVAAIWMFCDCRSWGASDILLASITVYELLKASEAL